MKTHILQLTFGDVLVVRYFSLSFLPFLWIVLMHMLILFVAATPVDGSMLLFLLLVPTEVPYL